MKKQHIHIIILILLSLLPVSAEAARQPDYYSRWSGLPSEQLLKMGHHYAEEVMKPDSALVCYTIVGSRYNDNLNDDSKEECLKGFIGRWYVYFL